MRAVELVAALDAAEVHVVERLLVPPGAAAVVDGLEEGLHLREGVGEGFAHLAQVIVEPGVGLPKACRRFLRELRPEVLAHERVAVQGAVVLPVGIGQQTQAAQAVDSVIPVALCHAHQGIGDAWDAWWPAQRVETVFGGRTVEPTEEAENGALGCGVVMDPAQITDITEADGNQLVLARTPAGKPAVWFAGTAWDRGGEITDVAGWDRMVEDLARRVASPLQVEVGTR